MSDQRAEARKLRERGWGYEAIGLRLGISKSTAYRWLNPDYDQRHLEAARDWKRRNRKRQRAYNRAYNDEHKGTCASCGGETVRGAVSGICAACRTDEADRKARKVVRLWAEGKSMKEICAEMGWSKGHLGKVMDRYRAQGYDLPYRYNGTRNGAKYAAARKSIAAGR